MEDRLMKDMKKLHHMTLSAETKRLHISWSDNISLKTSTALHSISWSPSRHSHGRLVLATCLLLALSSSASANASNVTTSVFGDKTDLLPAAFGDFNSDELTDLFALRNGGTQLEVLVASELEPLLRPAGIVCKFKNEITGVVPGDFDGDTHMDVLVTTTVGSETHVHLSWGNSTTLNCSNEDEPLLRMQGQPLAVDYNHDMTVDLFGIDINYNRVFWLFNTTRTAPVSINLTSDNNLGKIRNPHSHAFLDLDGDFSPDLILSTVSGFEIWLQNDDDEFNHSGKIIPNPPGNVGQSLFVDLELEGNLQHIVPVCFDEDCLNSTLYVYHKEEWHNLNPNFKDTSGKIWGFVRSTDAKYIDTITLRAGDFNMDGYPDLLATLHQNSMQKAFLLENVVCEVKASCDGMSRTFTVRWDALNPLNKDTSMAVFYDMYQDGILDVILATQTKVQAFRNTLDYDANFVKVMVLAGEERSGNLPGPRISYRTTTQEGNSRAAVTAQLPQSAHFALGLPYTIFGLGRTPNFIDTLTVGLSGKSREWTQIIPNSQMVVIPHPRALPGQWRARLFVTPSKLILLSVVALTGTCGLIIAIIAGLYLKERREDRIEKLQEAHRFHFDAM